MKTRHINSAYALNWNEFEEFARQEFLDRQDEQPEQCMGERKELLDFAQEKFKQYKSLKTMPIGDQRVIAGVCNLSGPEFPFFAWFGALTAVGKMKGYFNPTKPKQVQAIIISDALDLIPLEGEVTKRDFVNYINKFNEISSSKHPNMMSSYYRFLTLKRPDVFVGLNGLNNYNLNYLYEMPIKAKPNQYWEVLQQIKESSWYQNANVESQIYPYRMAFLDSICYQVTNDIEA